LGDFSLWFFTGLEHIADLNGYDHILFLLVLCAVYEPGQWKNILILITSFTIGHSITLALSSLEIISPGTPFIEFLIPVTILITAAGNLINTEKKSGPYFFLHYAGALIFGIIHGMGFSFLLKSMLGSEESPLLPLLYFNLGIEAGQVLIVVFVFLISLLLTSFFRVSRFKWNFFISSAGFGVAFVMALERLGGLLN
jgi:hypothetical protein